MPMKKIWIVVWKTESSDEGVNGYFIKEPTPVQLQKYMAQIAPDDAHAGTLYYHLEQLSLIKMVSK